ncbi:PqqD family protein [Legionella fallonii]|uniref:PqqD family protein n=1 Tax=Legionella fallonii LLAP-10 TaxID=1212491 RepID=A0A098G192_9GAMM|nr:PqqD family protein [Legionella fallonii]CEG55756.1 protein of unknown function [Legionella fallonii LLAP-10]
MEASILQRKIQKHPLVCATVIDNELVVMSSQDNVYYRINASGIQIWSFLESQICSVQTVVEFIADYYGLEHSQVFSDVQLFVLLMLEKGFLQYAD